jgi:hypothetical protein
MSSAMASEMTWIPPFKVHAALRLMVRESLIVFDGRTTRVAQTCRKHTKDQPKRPLSPDIGPMSLTGGEIRVPCGGERIRKVHVDDSMDDVIRL